MFYRGTFLRGTPHLRATTHGAQLRDGFYLRHGSSPCVAAWVAVWMVAIALLASPGALLAQHGAGRSQPGAPSSKPLVCVHDCLENNSGLGPEEDRQLEHLMAVQATDAQSASFNHLLQDIQAARDRLQTFIQLVKKVSPSSPPSDPAAIVDHAIQKARTGNQNFFASFTPTQKSGLKDVTKKVETADAELDKQKAALDRTLQIPNAGAEPIATAAANLDNALSNFQTEQLALGREMSIVLPTDGQEFAFSLRPVKGTVDLAGRSISIPVSGAASRTSAGDGRDQFSVRVVADFSELQQNFTSILRKLLAASPRCGERIEIQHASLIPQFPASLVVASLHFERWICPGGGNPMELASGDGTVEVKLSPSIEAGTGLHLASDFGRVEAEGLLRESLLTGSLGDTVRDQVAAALFPAMQKTADLKLALPPAAQESATLQKAQFQDAGAGQLRFAIDGQFQLSDEQTKQFGAQLQQPAPAQETSKP